MNKALALTAFILIASTACVVPVVVHYKNLYDADLRTFEGVWALRGLSQYGTRAIFDQKVEETVKRDGVTYPEARKLVIEQANEDYPH